MNIEYLNKENDSFVAEQGNKKFICYNIEEGGNVFLEQKKQGYFYYGILTDNNLGKSHFKFFVSFDEVKKNFSDFFTMDFPNKLQESSVEKVSNKIIQGDKNCQVCGRAVNYLHRKKCISCYRKIDKKSLRKPSRLGSRNRGITYEIRNFFLKNPNKIFNLDYLKTQFKDSPKKNIRSSCYYLKKYKFLVGGRNEYLYRRYDLGSVPVSKNEIISVDKPLLKNNKELIVKILDSQIKTLEAIKEMI